MRCSYFHFRTDCTAESRKRQGPRGTFSDWKTNRATLSHAAWWVTRHSVTKTSFASLLVYEEPILGSVPISQDS
jgi:hypothetical protein